MKLLNWFRERKERREAKRLERLAHESGDGAEELRPLVEENPDIVQAESRFTEVYQNFLKDLESTEAGQQKDCAEGDRTDGEENP